MSDARRPSISRSKKSPRSKSSAQENELNSPQSEQDDLEEMERENLNDRREPQHQQKHAQSRSTEFRDEEEHNGDPQREEIHDENPEESQEAMLDAYDYLPKHSGRGREIESQPSDYYMVETHFDEQSGGFYGSVLEFPDLTANGPSREVVTSDLESQLGQRIESLRSAGTPLPEPIHDKKYPETLQVVVSQSLYRRLDTLSRFEKLPLDRLVSELINRGLERRSSESRRPQQPQQHQHSQRHHGHRGNNRRQGHSMRGGGRNYHDSMQNRDNFMEYVRGLENRGGSGNWRKK